MRHVLLSLGAALALACSSGEIAGVGPGSTGGTSGGSGQYGGSGYGGEAQTCVQNDNDAIRLALAPSCEGCHQATASKPFFASLAAFETLLVYNEAYVVAGKPDDSKLLALLSGQGSGSYKQMPLTGDPFSALATQGKTQVTMPQLRDWITRLGAAPVADTPDPAAPTTRRLSAEEFLTSVEMALGYPTQTGGIPPLLGGSLQPLSPDSPQYIGYTSDRSIQAYKLLGGPSYLEGRGPEKAWSPSSLALVTQIAVRECGAAVQASSPVLFKHATLSDALPAGEAAIRKNLAYLHRRFLGLRPTDADTDALLQHVFVPASARGSDTAWAEVCAALIRHPYFVTF